MTQVTALWGLISLSGALSVLFLLRFSTQGPSLSKTAVKTASVAGLAVAAILAHGPVWLVLALTLASIGDFLLSRDGEGAFLAGLVAFALSHLAYVVLMLGTGAALEFGPLAVAVVIFGIATAVVLFPRAGALRWPVVVYVLIICAMAAVAVSLPASFLTAVVAALLFLLSDWVLGAERFLLSPQSMLRHITAYVIWTTYWLAQLLFLVAFAIERSL